MSTKFLSPGWRMPRNANQSKQSNYSLYQPDQAGYIETDYSINGLIQITVSCWIKTTSSQPNEHIWSFPKTGTGSGLALQFGSSANTGYSVTNYAMSGFPSVTDTSSVYNDGNWHNIIFTSSLTEMKLYVDGFLINTTSITATAMSGTIDKFFIGSFTNISPQFNAYNISFSDVCIFDYALSPSQVTTLWGGGTSVSNPMALPITPIAYYPLGESAGGFVGGTGTWLTENNAIGDYVFDFENSNNHYISGSASLPNSDYTISAWINLETVTTESIVTWGEDATGKRRSLFIWNGGSGAYKLYSSTYGSNIPGSTTLLTGQWYHAAVTVSSAAVAKIYLNGSLDGTGTNILNSFTGTNFYIGRTPSSEYFDGKISNVQIFNTVLSGPEVETLYNYGSPIQTLSDIPQNSDLELWYKLDASATYNSSTTTWSIPDDSSNSNTGISSGMSQSNLIQSDLQTVAPYSKYALSFDGTNDYIDLTSDITLSANRTISMWIKVNTGFSFAVLFGGDLNVFYPYIDTNNIAIRNNDTSTAIAHNGISVGVWYNFCVTGNGTTASFYQNGSLLGTGSDKNLTLKYINAEQAGLYGLNGSISNVSLWDVALTSSQVTEIYNEGLPSNLNTFSGTAPVVWWQLGENSSFNGNDWIVADEIGSNNGESDGMGVDALTNGVGTIANGTSTGMSESSLIGNAPYSTANAVSSGMAVTARGTNVP